MFKVGQLLKVKTGVPGHVGRTVEILEYRLSGDWYRTKSFLTDAKTDWEITYYRVEMLEPIEESTKEPEPLKFEPGARVRWKNNHTLTGTLLLRNVDGAGIIPTWKTQWGHTPYVCDSSEHLMEVIEAAPKVECSLKELPMKQTTSESKLKVGDKVRSLNGVFVVGHITREKQSYYYHGTYQNGNTTYDWREDQLELVESATNDPAKAINPADGLERTAEGVTRVGARGEILKQAEEVGMGDEMKEAMGKADIKKQLLRDLDSLRGFLKGRMQDDDYLEDITQTLNRAWEYVDTH